MKNKTLQEGKYKVGEAVWAKKFPELELCVRRYIDRIYFCTVPSEPAHKDFAYFERELFGAGEA